MKLIDYINRHKNDFLIAIIVCLLISCLSENKVPFQMDEFSHHHPIICSYYENNKLNVYREGCNLYDLTLPNTNISLPLRAFPYIGSLPALIYYPIFYIWKNPLSLRLLNIFYIFIQSIIISKLFKFDIRKIFIGLLLFFPYFYQHLVDTGTEPAQLLLIMLAIFLLKKWVHSNKIKHSVLLGLILFLGIWTKLTFVFYLPVIFLLGAFFLQQNKPLTESKYEIKDYISSLLIGLIVFLFLSYLYLFSTSTYNQNDKPILGLLLSYESNIIKFYADFKIEKELSNLYNLFINPYYPTYRLFEPFNYPEFSLIYSLLLYLFIPISILTIYKNTKKKFPTESALYYLCFILIIFLVFSKSKQLTIKTHHLALAYPFLIFSYLSLINFCKEYSKQYLATISKTYRAFIILNIVIFLTFTNQPLSYTGHSDLSRYKINNFLNNDVLAQKYFYVVVSWGMYYYQGLFGPQDQSVIYLEPFNNIHFVNELKRICLKHNRKALFIYNTLDFNPDLIKSSFKLERPNEINSDSIWQVLIEK